MTLNASNKILVDSIKRLMRRGATTKLAKIVNKTHGADLSIVFSSLTTVQQITVFNLIEDSELKGLLLSELDGHVLVTLVQSIKPEEVAKVLEEMPSDDAAELVDQLPEEIADEILKRMKRKEYEEVEDLLQYEEDTAGRIMVPEFIALAENATAREAIASLQKEHMDVEMPFYLYVLDDYGRLVGVSSLRQLVVVPPDTPLKKFMAQDVFYVHTSTDQEEVAKMVARYDILAVPVVDDQNRLVGIVTVDDVIDIIRMEATEDILKMAGAGEEFVETQSIVRSTRIRLPWLFASWLGGVAAVFIIGHFEASLNKLAYLAAFIPVIMGMGGNIGTQSSTIVVRGLATGRIHIENLWSVVSKEFAIGLILGVFYALFIGAVAQTQHSQIAFALSVSLGVLCSMSVAALVGSAVPMALARIRIDPAVATGPFVTTAIDIISVFCYFQIATSLLKL